MTTARKTSRTPGARKAKPRSRRDTAANETTLGGVVRGVRSWSESLLSAANTGANVARMLGMPAFGLSVPAASLQRGAAALKDLRQAAGLSVDDLAAAINLKDTTPLELMESGKIAIPFEIILRMAAVLGRNDPLPTALRLVRASNPTLARALEKLGIGKVLAHAEREREFLNLYRGNDALRGLSDAEFEKMLRFVDGALRLAMEFRGGGSKRESRLT